MCNVDATLVTTAEQARDALIRQVTGAVQWDKSMRALVALGVQNFVEVGPGKVLCGLMQQIDARAPASMWRTKRHCRRR